MSDQPLVFVSGPLTTGNALDLVENVRRACKAADEIVALGGIPVIPHLSIFWCQFSEDAAARSYDDWMQWCYAQLRKCAMLYRLPGESKGADLEVSEAAAHGIPVYYCLDSLAAVLAPKGSPFRTFVQPARPVISNLPDPTDGQAGDTKKVEAQARQNAFDVVMGWLPGREVRQVLARPIKDMLAGDINLSLKVMGLELRRAHARLASMEGDER